MKNQINTSEGNVQFITPDGKLMNVHPSHVYAVFNQDTVSFLLIAMPKSSGLAVFTSTAEDLLFNGETYTFEQLKTVIPEAFAEAGAQARCEIVDELPETGKTNTIYLVPKEEGEGYDEYIYLKDEQRWELIGDTSIEMNNYVKKVDFNSYSSATEIVINSISGAIDTEISNREAADTVISGAVDTLSTNLANEVSRAQNAETELSNKIDAVSGDTDDIQAELDVVSASLESEVSTRTEADDAFDARLDEDEKVIGESLNDLNTRMTANEAAESVISGAVDTLSTNLANEVSRAQNAETALDGKINELSGNVYTKSEVYNKTEVDEMFDNIDLSDYYTKSETSGKTELSTAFAAKQNVLTAGENIVISGDVISAEAGNDVTELTQEQYDALVEAGTVDPDVLYIITDAAPINLNNYYQKSETSSKTEIDDAISAEATARANADTALSGAVDTALLGYINGAEYVSTAKTINFMNGETVIDSIDATDFIKDGMVSNVEISGGSLVIEFNTDAGAEDIAIPLTDIFDPSNYYTKGETSGKTEIATALSAKLDTTAYTPTDLSNYYTKSQTSGATELSSAFDNKLDKPNYVAFRGDRYWANLLGYKDDTQLFEWGLIWQSDGSIGFDSSGTLCVFDKIDTSAITTSITTASTDSQVPSAKAVNDGLAAKLDSTAYTPTDLSDYYTSAQTESAITAAVSGKQDVSGMTAYTTTATTDALNTVVTAHTSDSTIHVTSANKTSWDGAVTASTANTTALGGLSLVKLSQAEYDALATKDASTLYVIVG